MNRLRNEWRWQRAMFPYNVRKAGERLAFWIAWRVPAWLVYFTTIRCLANATTGAYGGQVVPELGAMEALDRWGKAGGGDPRWR